MSERVKPPCVRGCTEPIVDPQTREKVGTRPREVETGNLCRKCAGQIRTWLRDIADLYAHLDPRPTAVRRDYTQPVRRGKISGSPALARLDVVVLQDWRTCGKANYREDGDDHALEASIPEAFINLANGIARDDLKISKRVNTLTDAIDFLTGEWFNNICYLDWVDDLYITVKDKRQLLRRTNNIRGPRPLGKCACGNTLFEPEPVPGATTDPEKAILECRECGHRMNAMAIIRLAAKERTIGETG